MIKKLMRMGMEEDAENLMIKLIGDYLLTAKS